MNKVENLTNLGGFPMTQYTLEFLQESFRKPLAAIAEFFGYSVIISGVAETSAGIISDGWICYKGEMLPFVGGPKQATWIIEDVVESRTFADQTTHDVYTTRRARFAAGGIPFGQLFRLNQLTMDQVFLENAKSELSKRIDGIWQRGDIIEIDVDSTTLANNFDSTGLGINLRKGWAICNGNNGTRDRGGLFPVGYKSDKYPYNRLGFTGGAETVTLTEPQMPIHNHQFYAAGDYQTDKKAPEYGIIQTYWDRQNVVLEARMLNAGGNQPHENRPPFIVTLFIMKL